MSLSGLISGGSTPLLAGDVWAAVPALVSAWYGAAEGPVRKLATEMEPGTVWFDLAEVRPVQHRTPCAIRLEKTADGVSVLPPAVADPLGSAADALGQSPLLNQPVDQGAGHGLASTLSLKENPLNRLAGGPTPLATTLTGSALGAGLGYLGGRIAENVLPGTFQGKRLRRTLMLAGGALGAAPGLYLGRLGAAADGTDYPHGLTSPGVLSAKKADAGLYGPSIQVDAFNRLVLDDPFAPPPLRAATVALTTAADRSTGDTGLISPAALARVAIGAGAGYLQAYAGAKVLGGLAGLSLPAQKALQQTGYVAGALHAVVPQLFGAGR